MINKDFEWFDSWWKQVASGFARRPCATLFVGPKGIGKTRFALELGAAWLCQHPLSDGSACGVCRSCQWMTAGQQHPDFRWVRPDAEAAADEQEGAQAPEPNGVVPAAGESSAEDSKKKSQEIRIEQIRGLATFANVGSHRGGLRVVLISPANRMNYAAANALLKTLEEPADTLAFILVADSLRGIPLTVLSRCRRINLAVPELALARIQTEQSQAADWLLPLLASNDIDPIRWAEKAGKSPPGDALEILMRWMTDASRVQSGLPPRSFPDHQAALREQAIRIKSPQSWSQTLAELQRLRAIAEHPLNPKLFYESIFDRMRRALV
jgi:DNA polymerase III subunit delta'